MSSWSPPSTHPASRKRTSHWAIPSARWSTRSSSETRTDRAMKKIDLSKIRTYSVRGRESKVRLTDFARPFQKGASFRDFFDSLPDILAGTTLKQVAAAVAKARKDRRAVMLGM